MRHRRQSKNMPFNGYERHLAYELATRLIIACAVTPASGSEKEAAPELEKTPGCLTTIMEPKGGRAELDTCSAPSKLLKSP